MDDIVLLNRGVIFTTSRIFAESFSFQHIHVAEKIKKLTIEYSIVRNQFKLVDFVNARNQTFQEYEITKDGFMTLVFQMGGAKSKKARDLIMEKQQLFIKAFNHMEQILLNQSNAQWVTAREQSKTIRSSETDAIKDFVEYAIAAGSSGAKFYYKHFTSATYKALSLLEHRRPKTRDTLDMLELHQLILAENLVTRVIVDEMKKGEHYKVIFEKCKVVLEKFADSLYLTKAIEIQSP